MKRSTNAEKAPGRDDITARTLRNDQNLESFGRECLLGRWGHNLDTVEYLGLSVGRGLDFQAHVGAAARAATMKFHRQGALGWGVGQKRSGPPLQIGAFRNSRVASIHAIESCNHRQMCWRRQETSNGRWLARATKDNTQGTFGLMSRSGWMEEFSKKWREESDYKDYARL
ncbi:hypothetical protein RUM43_006362 [Polyplax serrata]|uniref:Uncharacterized protein n=1 Tax=Polyplax serrata TaxID=468196 RepID=A0AAN8NT41_POLSC